MLNCMESMLATQGFDWLIAGVGVLTQATPNRWTHFNPWKDIILFIFYGSCPETNEYQRSSQILESE